MEQNHQSAEANFWQKVTLLPNYAIKAAGRIRYVGDVENPVAVRIRRVGKNGLPVDRP